MNWSESVNAYCERLDGAYWAEPVNAITNVAFLIAALIMWRRVRDMPEVLPRLLVWVLAMIGVGSWLFHTHAQVWAALADVVPILLFILIYIYAANLNFWGMGRVWALGATALFVPYAALTVPLFEAMPVYGASAEYMPVPVMIFVYGLALWRRSPVLGQGLVAGGAILMVSLLFRSLDGASCAAFPLGTHFMWHILNAVMLGWMIEVLRRHLIAQQADV